MGDNNDHKNNVAGSRGFESRLEDLEQRLVAAGQSVAEVKLLREAVDDLAADTLDLHNQMEKIVSSCERLLAGAGGDLDLSLNRGRTIRDSASTLRRVTGRAVRSTLGAARRLVTSRQNGPDAGLDLEIEVAAVPVGEAPRIAVVLRVQGDPRQIDVPAELRAQTEVDLEVVVWNEESSTAVIHSGDSGPTDLDPADRSDLAAALTAGYVAEMSLPLPRIEPTILEICRWTIASEGLPLVVGGAGLGTSDRSGWSVTAMDRWAGPAKDGDLQGPPTLTKMVGCRSWHPTGTADSAMIGAGGGCGYLPAPGVRGPVVHEIAPFQGVVRAVGDDDPGTAVLLASSRPGLSMVAWLLRELGDDFRPIVTITDDGAVGTARFRALTELAREVYPIADFIDPALLPFVIGDLIRSRGVRTVLRIGTAVEVAEIDGPRPFVVDLPLEASEIGAGADLVLALGGGIAKGAKEREIETVELVAAPDFAGSMPQAGRLAQVRSAYGVPEDALLVLAVGDLVPVHRPEDVAAVAQRLSRREDVFVLLIGEGPLAGTVSDMAGYFQLDRFSLAPPGHSLLDLVASCDCLLNPSERDPWPVSVAAALAVGRSVVATEIDGVRELVAAANGDRCVLRPPGDVDGLAEAVVEALDSHRKPMVTKKAWAASDARRRRCLTIVREALGRGAVDDTEQR